MHTCDNIGKASKKSIGALCGRSCFSCLDFFFPGLLPIWSITHFDALLPLGLDIRFVVASDPISHSDKVCERKIMNSLTKEKKTLLLVEVNGWIHTNAPLMPIN